MEREKEATLSTALLFGQRKMLVFKRLQDLILLFVLTLVIACCSHGQLQSASANSSAYTYLAKVADQFRAAISNTTNKPRNELSFLVSYETNTLSTKDFDRVMHDVAFTYDNAVATLAFIASGDQQRAKQVVDTLIAAQNRDRFYKDGRIRNAYRGGKLIALQTSVDLPGWYDSRKNRWQEDEFQVSTHTGNVAWGMLALLGYYETFGGDTYLAAAQRMGEWVDSNCRDNQTPVGYTGGFTGWENHLSRLTYKATEHNLDLYAAFERLFLITGNQLWQERATRSLNFVLAMWDEAEGKFWTGTQPDGVTINRDFIPLDIQAWAVLALRDALKTKTRSLEYAEHYLQIGGGFDFNQDRDGIWYEGTAQMAVAYQFTGQLDKSTNLISTLLAAQDISGGIPATDRDGLTTGISLPDGQPWLYFKRLHVGATGWFVLAQKNVNPFWLGSKSR